MPMRPLVAACAGALLAGCAARPGPAPAPPPAGAEAVSLLGDTLRAPALAAEVRRRYEAQLDSARRAAAADPDDADALIWVGRRTAYLGHYREAIAVFSRGIERWPRDARFYRHRGHRWITVREFSRARRDLERAAELMRARPDEVEPDGLPNARGIPTSTLRTNILYHLGLAHWLLGDPVRARAAWQECLRAAGNPDMDVATRYWLYLADRRLGRTIAAQQLLEPVRADLDIIENHSYHRLLLVFKGDLPVDSLAGGEGLDGATTAYGLGAWQLAEGHRPPAVAYLRRARAGGQWAAFGFIAAEADLAALAAGRP